MGVSYLVMQVGACLVSQNGVILGKFEKWYPNVRSEVFYSVLFTYALKESHLKIPKEKE
jgi:hypothetical protein